MHFAPDRRITDSLTSPQAITPRFRVSAVKIPKSRAAREVAKCTPTSLSECNHAPPVKSRGGVDTRSGYFPSTENASSTFPGVPFCTYPELTNNIPPLIAGPPTFSDPPRPGTPLTVS